MLKKPLKNLRWLIAALVFLSTVINYVDRQTLSVLAPLLTKDLGLSNIEYGWISQAFLIPYTAMFIVSGILIDRYGVKMVYAVATAWWSIAAMLHAVASSAMGLGVFRFLLGTAESANFVGAEKVAAEWYPPKDRGTLNGLVQAGTVTGALITPPIVVWLSERYGWRAAFLFTGSLGLFWVIAWLAIYHLPERHPRITEEELLLIRGGSPKAEDENAAGFVGARWIDFFSFRQTWGLLFARIISDPVWWFYLFWLPKYLTEGQGLTMKQMSYVVLLPYLASDFGSILGGWYSGRLIARGGKAVMSRRAVMLISALLMPFGLLLVLKPSTPATIALISLVLLAHSSWKTNLVTMTVDIFPRRVVASVHGIVATGGGIGGALFTTLAGYVIEWHSYTPILVLMGFLHPLAYLCVRWLVKGEATFRQQRPKVYA
ncbi:MAG: MFS transporter [Acidobacteria bacterium]|nr:MFS transporter [Acidobacteriota bacterium]